MTTSPGLASVYLAAKGLVASTAFWLKKGNCNHGNCND
jgi:hypothetical protein